MKKYVCPHCGEPTITPLQKAFAGNQKSKGVICPNCGGRCTNGMKSAVFHTITCFIGLAAIVVMYIVLDESFLPCLGVLVAVYLINTIVDAFFFPLAESLRID